MGVFDKSSLALVPDGIKDGKLYPIKPTDGSGDFIFSRGSNLAATRVDENGLIEKGRENLLLQSNQFDTTWVAGSNLTVTSGQSDRNGTNAAWLLSKSSSNRFIYQDLTSSGVQTYSVYIKAGTSSWVRLVANTSNFKGAYFDLSNGATGYIENAIDATIESVGNDWYRCSVIFEGAVTRVRIYPAEQNSTDGTTGSIYIQDAQLEQGLVSTDYIETGATTAQAGILEDLPRIDYTGGTPSLLMEPSRTNLIDHSEYLKGNTEFKILSSSVTFADYTETSPEGNPNALRILETSGTGNHNWYYDNLGTFVNGTTYTFSFFAKSINGRNIRFDEGGVGMDMQGIIDLSDGSILQDAHSNVSVESYGNGWYRVSAVGTMNGTIQRIIFNTTDGTTTSFPGDTTKGVSLWGVQIEQASYPTSYIPTYGATATRGEDLITTLLGAAQVGNNLSEGTWFIDFIKTGQDGNNQALYLAPLNSNSQIIRLHFDQNQNARFRDAQNGYPTIGGTVTNTTSRTKMLVKVDLSAGIAKVFANGAQVGSDYTLGAVPFEFSRILGYGKNFKLFSTVFFPEVLSDAECITLTT